MRNIILLRKLLFTNNFIGNQGCQFPFSFRSGKNKIHKIYLV